MRLRLHLNKNREGTQEKYTGGGGERQMPEASRQPSLDKGVGNNNNNMKKNTKTG